MRPFPLLFRLPHRFQETRSIRTLRLAMVAWKMVAALSLSLSPSSSRQREVRIGRGKKEREEKNAVLRSIPRRHLEGLHSYSQLDRGRTPGFSKLASTAPDSLCRIDRRNDSVAPWGRYRWWRWWRWRWRGRGKWSRFITTISMCTVVPSSLWATSRTTSDHVVDHSENTIASRTGLISLPKDYLFLFFFNYFI